MKQPGATGGLLWRDWLRERLTMSPRRLAGNAKRRIVWALKHSSAVGAARDRASLALARLRRPRLHNVTFVGVTGSCAKTTTCVLAKAVLLPGDTWRRGSSQEVAQAVLTLDPSIKFHVQELSADEPGKIARNVALLKPNIGIVTVIGSDHYKNYRSPEAVAREKGNLIEQLPADGVAILNADDPHVLAMASRTSARVVTYGRSPVADVRAIEVSSAWPQLLELGVTHGDQRAAVRTQLVGEHWATSVLAAIACGVACGRTLQSCAAAVERVEPLFGRYSVHRVPNESNYILDTFKASSWTIASALEFVRKASAPRKTIVIGTLTDYAGNGGRTHRRVVREALKVADRVAIVGPHANYVDKLRAGEDRDRVFGFTTSFQASAFLAETAFPGEFIYVKGNSRTDHLERLMLAQLEEVVCWRESCGIKGACPKCVNYRKPEAPPLRLSHDDGDFEVLPRTTLLAARPPWKRSCTS